MWRENKWDFFLSSICLMVGLCLGSYSELKQTVDSRNCCDNELFLSQNRLWRPSPRIPYWLARREIHLNLNGQFDCFFSIKQTWVLFSPRLQSENNVVETSSIVTFSPIVNTESERLCLPSVCKKGQWKALALDGTGDSCSALVEFCSTPHGAAHLVPILQLLADTSHSPWGRRAK